MIKRLKRFAKQQELLIENIGKSENLVEITCPSDNEKGRLFRSRIANLYGSRFIKEDKSPNPNFMTCHQIDLSFLPVDPSVVAACELALFHSGLEGDLDTPLKNLWVTFLGVYAAALGHTTFTLSDNSDNLVRKRFYLQIRYGTLSDFLKHLAIIVKFLDLPMNFTAQPANATAVTGQLSERYDRAIGFYINRQTAWLQKFSDNLGDDLSRAALFYFLKQRMQGKIFYDTDILYALTPSPQSAQRRIEEFAGRREWPWLVSSTVSNLPFMVVNTFLLEQYRIPGIVEVKPGDNVLDVGAAFGDSSVYFSNLVGAQGRILAIDPLPDNLEDLRKNLALHDCNNVQICSYGLGETESTLWVHSNATDSNSVAEISEQKCADSSPVAIKTIDGIASNMRVDFIKADIEGAELAMLHGGKNTIMRDKPTIALALYHKENDFREFPQTLSEYNPDYVYFIRLDAEPMFFAIDKNKLNG